MQTIKGFLDIIKEFLDDKLEEYHILLPEAPGEGMQGEDVNLIKPAVNIGSLPHANFTTYGMDGRFLTAPYIALGIEGATYDDNDEAVSILIQVCCYSTEAYEELDEAMEGLKIPDNQGTLDVFNLLENIKEWIVKEAPFPVQKPITLGSYDTKEMTYPYSFGYLSFDIKTNEGKSTKIDFDKLQ